MSARAWTDHDLGVLVDTMDQPVRAVADELNRTPLAVQSKRRQIRNGWTRTKADDWTPDDDDFLRSVPDFTPTQVARHLGRTRDAVVARRRALGLPDARGKRLGDPGTVNKRTLVAKTCTRCGLLLDSTWFGRDSRGGWRTSCVRCRNAGQTPAVRERGIANSRRAIERLQAISLPYATRHGEPYVARDAEVLRDPDLSNLEKAVTLGRTYRATVQAVSKFGYASKADRGDPADVQWIIRLREGVAA